MFKLAAAVLVLSLIFVPCIVCDERHQSVINADNHPIYIFVDPNYTSDANNPLRAYTFQNISSAIDWIPYNASNRFVILVEPGVYREKITIPKFKDYITLQGQTKYIFDTVIVYNANHGSANGTGKSATFEVFSRYFNAQYITFQNDAPFANPGAHDMQAVALKLSGDFAKISDCFILSSQDTLYDDHGRHYFKNTYIEGNIDFIFGFGRSLYERCNLISNVNATTSGSLTAQGKAALTNFTSGYSFHNCYLGGTGKMTLGRPWGSNAFVVFSNCYMEAVVDPVGWTHWTDSYGPSNSTAFFAEYQNYGPGAHSLKRANWTRTIKPDVAEFYASTDFIDGSEWL